MATVTVTIGATGRDYADIPAWEADLDNDVPYDAGDDVIGECYNDAVYTWTSDIVLISGTTLGLNSIRLRCATGEGHDGTAGSGYRLVRSSGALSFDINWNTGIENCVVERLEFDFNASNSDAGAVDCNRGTNNADMDTHGFLNCIAHNIVSNRSADARIYDIGGRQFISNCIGFNITNAGVGGCRAFEYTGTTSRIPSFYNNVAWDVTDGGAAAYGFYVDGSNAGEMVNNIAAGISGTTSSGFLISTTMDHISHNASFDSSAEGVDNQGGGTNITGIDPSTTFVSVTPGSEDLHLIAGAAVIDQGYDLGISGLANSGVDGRDRNAEGDDWDMGWHEFVSAAAVQRAAFLAIMEF